MSVEFRPFDSKSELMEHLGKAGTQTVLIGADVVENPRRCYGALWLTRAAAPIEIGLLTDGIAPQPALHVMARGELVLVGYDAYAAGIEVATATVRFQIELARSFFEFLPGASDDTAIVVHEIGVMMIDAQGERRWSVDTDILGQWHNDGTGCLWLRSLYEEPELMRVGIATGEISR